MADGVAQAPLGIRRLAETPSAILGKLEPVENIPAEAKPRYARYRRRSGHLIAKKQPHRVFGANAPAKLGASLLGPDECAQPIFVIGKTFGMAAGGARRLTCQ